ncbi:MAG: Histidine--tRNA ligase [Tenericutes bacterium ADurb.Bin087]|nr:MAG: Histidine--tRNA ligase [Tenericutes bacterium ADurb.Bin087]
MAIITSPKGTHDLIGNEDRAYAYISDTCGIVARLYGFDPLTTPIFEANELFARGVGDATDIVRKEMYVFIDKGNRLMALRPEGTAGVMRSIIANKLYATNDLPLRYYYSGPMFRYERPQLGRYRQFHQFGVESVGSTSIIADLEVILLAIHSLQALGLENITTKINSLGKQEARDAYREALKKYYEPHLKDVCPDCKVRYEQNPLRMLDCKVPSDVELAKAAPKVTDFLTEEDKKDLEFIKTSLEEYGVNVEVDYGLVRGLDYYSGIIFEFVYIPPSGKDYGAIGGGGRYDKLVEELGGPSLEGVGFAFGLERLYHILNEEGKLEHTAVKDDFILVAIGEEARTSGYSLLTALRANGLRGIMNFEDKSFKSLFKIAENRGARVALILGEAEIKNEVVGVRNLETQEQVEVPFAEVINYILDLCEEYHACNCGCDHEDCDCDNHDHKCKCGCEHEDCDCDHEECECDSHKENGECCGEHHHDEKHECCRKHEHEKNHECTGKGKGRGVNCKKHEEKEEEKA